MKAPPMIVRAPAAAAVPRRRRGVSAWHVLAGAAAVFVVACGYLAVQIAQVQQSPVAKSASPEKPFTGHVYSAQENLAASIAAAIGQANPKVTTTWADWSQDDGKFRFSAAAVKSIMDKPDQDPAKKAWILSVCTVLGDLMNQHPDLKVQELTLLDASDVQKREHCLVIDAAVLPDLEARASRHAITLDQMYALILSARK